MLCRYLMHIYFLPVDGHHCNPYASSVRTRMQVRHALKSIRFRPIRVEMRISLAPISLCFRYTDDIHYGLAPIIANTTDTAHHHRFKMTRLTYAAACQHENSCPS